MSTIVQSHLTGELPDPHLISWFQLDAGAGYMAARIASYTGERGPDVCFNRLRSLTSSKLRAYWKRVVETVSMIRTYIPPRQVGDGPWTPWYADYYHPAV